MLGGLHTMAMPGHAGVRPPSARSTPIAPWCVVLRMTAQPIPAVRALSIARRIAIVVTRWPSARSPSMSAVAAVSRSTRIFGRAFMSPLASRSTYQGIRRTPWESTPRRFAQTSTSASSAASSGRHPAATKTPLVNSWSSAAGIRISSAMDRIASGGRGAGIE